MAEGGEGKKDVVVKEQLLHSARQTECKWETPKHLKYEDIQERMSTFKTWKADPSLANKLAEFGQIYTGVNCTTRCYSCDGGHKNWKAGDDPVKIHAEEYPECELIKQLRDVNIREDNPSTAEAVNEAQYKRDKRDTSTATDDETGNREPPQPGCPTSGAQLLENPPQSGKITAPVDSAGSVVQASTTSYPDTHGSEVIYKRGKSTDSGGMPAAKRTKFLHPEADQACLENGCSELEVKKANEKFKQDSTVTREPSGTELYIIINEMRDQEGDPTQKEKETMTDPFKCPTCNRQIVRKLPAKMSASFYTINILFTFNKQYTVAFLQKPRNYSLLKAVVTMFWIKEKAAM